jgi:hypothetical protein
MYNNNTDNNTNIQVAHNILHTVQCNYECI